MLDKKRADNLVQAEKHMNFGKFEEAQLLIGDIIAHNPTPQQHEKATAIKDEIERRRRAKRDLQAYMNMLASANRREVEAAQFELLKDPETSLSILAEASRRTDKPVLASNAVETQGMIRNQTGERRDHGFVLRIMTAVVDHNEFPCRPPFNLRSQRIEKSRQAIRPAIG